MNPGFYFLFATLFVAQCMGDAPQAGIQELIKEGQQKFDKALEEIKTQAGLSKDPNGAEIVKKVREQSDKLAESMKEMRKKIEEQLKNNPEGSEIMKNIQAKLKEASDKLKKENPEIAQNAQKLGDAMKSAWDSLAQEMEKGYKEFNKKGGKRDEIDEFFKNIIDKGNAAAKELQTKIQEVVKKA